jgi:hypothetical protein
MREVSVDIEGDLLTRQGQYGVGGYHGAADRLGRRIEHGITRVKGDGHGLGLDLAQSQQSQNRGKTTLHKTPFHQVSVFMDLGSSFFSSYYFQG